MFTSLKKLISPLMNLTPTPFALSKGSRRWNSWWNKILLLPVAGKDMTEYSHVRNLWKYCVVLETEFLKNKSIFLLRPPFKNINNVQFLEYQMFPVMKSELCVSNGLKNSKEGMWWVYMSHCQSFHENIRLIANIKHSINIKSKTSQL